MHKWLSLNGSFAQKLSKNYCYSPLKAVRLMVTITIILVIAGTSLTVGLIILLTLSSSSSPMSLLLSLFIQSAEATTTTPPVQSCYYGFTATIVGTNNDDVTQGTEGNDVIVGLNGD
jgi:hypothetical protein